MIATPGRLLDHLRRGTIELSSISTFVLDEADQMLHMGFLPEVEEIIATTSPDRQTLLFSATMPAQVRSLAKRFLRQPEDIHVQGKRITLDDIKQIVVETTDRQKQATLRGLLDEARPRGLVQQIKSFERVAAEAAVTGDYHKALLAMNINPLVHSDVVAKKILDEMLEAHKDYLPQFFKPVS